MNGAADVRCDRRTADRLGPAQPRQPLCECLDALTGAVACHAHFNGRGAFGLRPGAPQLARFAPTLGHTPADARDPALIAHFRTDPHTALDTLARAAADEGLALMGYKVFPRQVTMPVLASLMRRPRTRVGFILRNRLDTFISYEKARQQDAWKGADTTLFRPDLDPQAFLAWAAETDRWFADTVRLAQEAGHRPFVWRYDADIDVGKPALVAALAETLAAAGVAVAAPPTVGRTRHVRQDETARPFRKIANGPAVRQALRAARRLRYARSEPDLPPAP